MIERPLRVGAVTPFGRYFEIGSSSATSFFATMSASSVPVNVLLMEPISNTVFSEIGAAVPALPAVTMRVVPSASRTPSAMPGVALSSTRNRSMSLRSAVEAKCGCAAAVAGNSSRVRHRARRFRRAEGM